MELKSTGQSGQVAPEFKSLESRKVEISKAVEEISKNKEYRDGQEEIVKAVEKLNEFLKDDNIRAEYQVHEFFGDLMIKIVDENTKEVLMEVPPKKILDVVAKMCELAGVFVDKKA